jgi:hypothetical protein
MHQYLQTAGRGLVHREIRRHSSLMKAKVSTTLPSFGIRRFSSGQDSTLANKNSIAAEAAKGKDSTGGKNSSSSPWLGRFGRKRFRNCSF